ncbi:MAG TPA: DUF4349 domain-containing protein [Longimicrobiales bacterium]|nr:DUF4349 domain-containing protein [Longimicrobiales bacterium]
MPGRRAAIVFACLALAGCDAVQSTRSDASTEATADLAMPPAAPAPSAMKVAGADAGMGSSLRIPAQATLPQGMIVRRATSRIEVDSLERAMSAVRALATRVGGHVTNVVTTTGREEYRQATLELKVPAGRFDDALSSLEPLGQVEAIEISAEDVGEEYVDVNARIANARRLEERLLGILATRTGKLEDVLAVERELARVREEIERMEARLRYLDSRIAFSTLSVHVHEPPPLLSRPGDNVMLAASIQAWRNFVRLMAGTVAALGFVLPLGALGTAIVWAIRRWRRSRFTMRPQTAAPPA